MNSLNHIHVGLLVGTLNSGGAERMMVQLANALASEGVQVHLYVVNLTGPYQKEINDVVNLIDLKAKRGVKSVIFALRNILKKDNLDVLIATQPHINTTISLAGFGLKHKPVIILREASTPSHKYADYGLLSRVYYKLGHALANYYIAVSKGVKEDMVDYYKLDENLISVIYNPIVDENLLRQAKQPLNHPWLLDNRILVIVSMSRLVPLKDHPTLIKAFAKVKKKIDAKLILLGEEQDVKYTRQIRDLIHQLKLESSVDISGFQVNPFAYLSRASLFVLSSRREGLPGALVQAMACGCPVVSTDCPSGPAEILENGKYGKLVPVGDEEQLAQAMIDSLSEKQNTDQLKQRAWDFSVDRSVQQYLTLIEQMVKRKIG